MSRAVSSPTRIPLAYSSSRAARSRRCMASWSSLATAATSMQRRGVGLPQHLGQVTGALGGGQPQRGVGGRSARSRVAQPEEGAGGAQTAARWWSGPRRARSARPARPAGHAARRRARSVMPHSAARKPSEAAHVAEVGPRGVLGPATLAAQVALERAAQRLRRGLGSRRHRRKRAGPTQAATPHRGQRRTARCLAPARQPLADARDPCDVELPQGVASTSGTDRPRSPWPARSAVSAGCAAGSAASTARWLGRRGGRRRGSALARRAAPARRSGQPASATSAASVTRTAHRRGSARGSPPTPPTTTGPGTAQTTRRCSAASRAVLRDPLTADPPRRRPCPGSGWR